MSADSPHADLKNENPFPALDLADFHSTFYGPDTQPSHGNNSHPFHAAQLKLETPSPPPTPAQPQSQSPTPPPLPLSSLPWQPHDTPLSCTTAAQPAEVQRSQFGDEPFSPHHIFVVGNIRSSSSMVGDGRPAAAFGGHAQRAFATPLPPSTSFMRERQSSLTSISVNTLSTDHLKSSNAAARHFESADGSEGGSPESTNQNGGHALDEAMSDDFGLATGGSHDAEFGLCLGEGSDMTGAKIKEEKGDMAPAWSELKTKAGKERKRLPLACIACRRKKIRCSGEKPACKHCFRSRIPCVYKVTARKAAPRTDYMAMLDKRLKRMEERIIKIIPRGEHETVAVSVIRAVVKPNIPGSLAASKSAGKKRGADEAFGHDMDAWARNPARSKLDGPNKPSPTQVQEVEENKLLLEGAEALPPKDVQEHLAEVFFENIYGQAYHLLHKPSYMRKLRSGTLPPVLVLSVCAIAARFSTHPKINTHPNFLRGEEWAAVARDIVTRRYEWPNMTILTCLLILGLHEFGTCHGGRSWALGGQAIRMAFALQLHKDLEHDPLGLPGRSQLSFVDREIRRRTMWACFLMDRFNSSGTDRPTFLREETLKIPLPIKEKNFQLDMPGPTLTLDDQPLDRSISESDLCEARNNMGVAAWMIRAIAIWGRIISYLNQGGKELDPHPMWSSDSEYAKLSKQAEEIAMQLPTSLTYTLENLHQHDTENMANQFLFLHISIQQNILFMSRFAVSSPTGHREQDVPKSFVTKAGAKAFAAATRVSEILKDAETHLVTAPFMGYCAFLSSTVHIFGIFSGNPTMEATCKQNLCINVKFLSKMKRYWGMFHWMSENLREQYRHCIDTARQGNNPASENSTSPIFQYGDWFDRYPHGVSKSDFLDPAVQPRKGDDAVLEQKPDLHTVEEYLTTLSPNSVESAHGPANRPGQPQPRPQSQPSSSHNQQQHIPNRRKSGLRNPSSASRSDASHHEPLQTEMARQEALRAQRMRVRVGVGASNSGTSVALSGQPNAFHPLGLSQNTGAASYHAAALSPVSPATASQLAVAHHQPQPPHAFFPPDPFAISLSSPSHGLHHMDRQLVLGAYGTAVDPQLSALAGWAHNAAEAGRGGEQRHGHVHGDANLQPAGFGAADGTSNWYMPYGIESHPDLNPALGGMTMDCFSGLFEPGMATGMHHGGP